MQGPTEAGIFGSVNARNLTPSEVAQTFVPPPSFERLLRQSNAVVVGPRGSGKTTLLKMLHQDAFEAWEHPEANRLLSGVRFVSVFVPTDYRWARQLDELGEGQLSPEIAERFAVAAYTTHALRALTNSMLSRIRKDATECVRLHGRGQLSSEEEAKLSRQLAGAWGISPEVPSLLAVRQALTKRVHQIRALADAAARSDRSQDDLGLLEMPLIESLALGVELCNDALGERDRHWALAMDELEFAPRPIVRELLRALRGADQALLFKLALAPAGDETQELEATLAAAPEQDYEPIQLWYHDRKDGEAFCERLWDRMVAAKGCGGLSAVDALGASYFEPSPGPGGDPYEPGSKWAGYFERLSEKDDSFSEYLSKHGVDPKSLNLLKGGKKAGLVRKVAPLLPLRDFFRGEERQRSRKRASLYAGATSLFAISEGNPRWFIGLVGRLLDQYQGSQLDQATQARAMEATSERFRAYLQTFPTSTVEQPGTTWGVLDIVERIAEAIHDEHVRGPFKPEPFSTFVVPSALPTDHEELLKVALNAGGIIYIPRDSSQLVVGDLEGKRFRVSYLLAPLYGLPLRLGKAVSLRTILERSANSEQRTLPLEGGTS